MLALSLIAARRPASHSLPHVPRAMLHQNRLPLPSSTQASDSPSLNTRVVIYHKKTPSSNPTFKALSYSQEEKTRTWPALLVAGVVLISSTDQDDKIKEKLVDALADNFEIEMQDLEQLISAGVNLRDYPDLWVHAAKSFRTLGCEFLLKHIPDLINEVDANGISALQNAIDGSNDETVKFLLQHGASALKDMKLNSQLREKYNFGYFQRVTPQEFAEAVRDEYRDDNLECENLRACRLNDIIKLLKEARHPLIIQQNNQNRQGFINLLSRI